MGTREDALALADELEAFEGDTCERCAAYEQPECNVYLPCPEIVAKYCARRIREAVERDGEGATTVSAHDLLSEDDRKAIAWVREHGGLGAVEKRLMPEGMEWILDVWPRWSNGEYCKFGDWWKAVKYGEREPQQLSRLLFFTPEQLREWGQDEGENFGYEWNFMRPSDTTYRPDKVEPPAPKALDADGVEIRVGDTVYGTVDMEYRITSLSEHEPSVVHAKAIEGGNECGDELIAGSQKLNSFQLRASKLTHQRPVLDADGVPIKEGDTVYLLPGEWCDRFPCLWFYGGEELNVLDLNPKYGDIGSIKCCKAGKMTSLCYPKSSQLTHTKPEPPDSRQAVVNEIGDEMAARIDLLVSSGRWSDAD